MKKGFTLIELLAVITILAIIAIIVTVSISSVISSSKSKLSETQTKNIEKIAEAFYIKEGIKRNISCVDVSDLIDKGYIESDSIKDPLSGYEMTGSVKIINNSNKISYDYQSRSCYACKCAIGTDGDKIVTCGTESFYVMYETPYTIAMLAEYNLNTTTPPYLQDKTGNTNPVAFSQSTYWIGGAYAPAGDSEYLYVYNDNSTVYEYIDLCVEKLSEMGVGVINTGLMNYEQAIALGCSDQDNTCKSAPKWIYSSNYWFGSVAEGTDVWHIGKDAYIVEDRFNYPDEYGIRPVIIISTDNIKPLNN